MSEQKSGMPRCGVCGTPTRNLVPPTRYLITATLPLVDGPVVSCHREVRSARDFARDLVMSQANKFDTKDWVSRANKVLDLVKHDSPDDHWVIYGEEESKFRVSIDALVFPERAENTSTVSVVVVCSDQSTQIAQVEYGPNASVDCIKAALFIRSRELSQNGTITGLLGRVGDYKRFVQDYDPHVKWSTPGVSGNTDLVWTMKEWPKPIHEHAHKEAIIDHLFDKDVKLLSFLNGQPLEGHPILAFDCPIND